MGLLRNYYRRTGWNAVFSMDEESAAARTYLLGSSMLTTVVGNLTNGIFYTGFLLSYGIDIVNLSILATISSIAPLFSLLTPYILDRFKSRRVIVSVARIIHYVLNILGITVLPELIQDPQLRITGLIVISFTASAINALFAGYGPWHMYHIHAEVRTAYFSATALLSNLVGQGMALLISLLVDSLDPAVQQTFFTVIRLVGFALALWEVYLLQKPKEPEYLLSTKPSLINIIRLPMANRRFRLTMLVSCVYWITVALSVSVVTPWLIQTVGVSYTFQTALGAVYPIFVFVTSSPWGKVLRKLGTFRALALSLVILGIIHCANAFVTSGNYLWLLAIVCVAKHATGMLLNFSTSNLSYITLPKEDQTCFTSLFSIVNAMGYLVGIAIGTWLVAVIGESTWNFLGFRLTAVPIVLLIQGVATAATGILSLIVQPHAEPEAPRLNQRPRYKVGYRIELKRPQM